MEYLSRRNLRAASLALLCFLYPIVALSFFEIKYTETINRITMSQTFDISLFGSVEADSLAVIGFGLLFLALTSRLKVSKVIFGLLFAASLSAFFTGEKALIAGSLAILPTIVGLLLTAAVADRMRPLRSGAKRLPFEGKRVAAAFLVIVIIIEAAALARWIAYPIIPSEIYSDVSWKFAELESALFHSLGLLSPVFVVLLAFSFLYRWYILDGLKRIGNAIVPARKDANLKQETVGPAEARSRVAETLVSTKSSSLVVTYAETNTLTSKSLHRGLLALALVVAPLLMIYPHLPGINPGGEGVSTDEQYYTRWMSLFRASIGGDGSLAQILSTAFTINNGDRPLTLLAILAISNLSNVPDLIVIRFLPVVLAPALVAANYFLLRKTLSARQFGPNRVKVFAAIGSVLAIFSPQIVVGEYAGLLANWIALTVAYFAFYLMIRGWESADRRNMYVSFGALFAILLVTMLIHLYTWAHLLAVCVLFAGLSFLLFRKSVSDPKIKALLMIAIVAASFSIDYGRSLYFSTPAAAEGDSALASNIEARDPSSRWDRLYVTLGSYVGGFLSNPTLFLLALVWIVRSKSSGLSILMLSMIFMLSVPVAIGSVEFQTRVLYNTPIHIAAVMALMWTGGRLGRTSDDKTLQKLLIVGVIFVMATFALRAMANLPLVLPEGYELERDFLLS